MKTLIIMRHGKYTEDFNTSEIDSRFKLTEDGKYEVAKVADGLRMNYDIDALYASPTLRTRETARIVAKTNKIRNIRITDDLRELGDLKGKTAFDVFSQMSDKQDTVCIVTHSPNQTAFVRAFCKQDDKMRFADQLTYNNTETHKEALVMTFDINSWSELKPGTICSMNIVNTETATQKRQSEFRRNILDILRPLPARKRALVSAYTIPMAP